jgi:hypothetical protein
VSTTAAAPASDPAFDHRHAAHCESGTVATLLRTRGLELSEAMVFGIGGGLFFLHVPWVSMGGMPLTAYRDAPRCILKNIGKRLGVRWRSHRYRDAERGRRELDDFLERDVPVGIQANIFWLPYFPEDMRFQYNGHNLVVYGKRADEYLISDPVADRTVTCAADALQRARFAKGLFAPRGLIYYPEDVNPAPDLRGPVREAIRTSAKRMLEIPVPLFGVRGIRFLARRMENWPKKHGEKKAKALVGFVVRMQEEIGTGGAGFRFLYAAFLQEAGELIGNPELEQAAHELSAVGDRWRDFAVAGAKLIRATENGPTFSELASIMRECAAGEEAVFRRLLAAS